MPTLKVAAIDFGTTFSGYAYFSEHEYKRDPLKISTNADTGGLASFKTSTCVLFDPTRKFHSFGYEAEENYSALKGKNYDWYYFRKFKMMVYDKMGFTRETLIKDGKGKTMEAITVFSSAIGYLKSHLFTNFKKQSTSILDESDITWVLTVPAIWDDKSRQFMREAAEKVGICRERLTLVLEPEAATLYCRHFPVRPHVVFKSGEKYMVIDAGGGTTDITVNEVKDDGSIKELHKASGCDWGGKNVDASFISVLADIVGKDVMENFSVINDYDFLNLLKDFEIKKRTVSPDLNESVTFKVPKSLPETFSERNPRSQITDVILNSKYKDHLTWIEHEIRMDANLVKTLFDEICKEIVDYLNDLFMVPAFTDVSRILLVGGFAESVMLKTAIKEAFQNKKIIIPKEAGLAMLKGAVLFGQKFRKNKPSLLVAAIDFGTTFSGYAFSFLHEYNTDPLKISAATWNAGEGGFVSLKTSTCVLFDPTKTFHCFGYDAEEKYLDLADEDKHHDWFFFRRFKMMLYNNMDLTRETIIEDEKGKTMEALKVFTSSIGYLKNELLTKCKNQTTDINESEITWVLTVPAIWDDKSRQFMREAAEKVPIYGEKLILALEPEAASFYCRHLPVQKDSDNSTYGVFKSGEKYMVVDAGGGTIDIIVHEVKGDGYVRELYKASGGDWGGTKVDASFISLLADVVGKDVMETFRSDKKYDFLYLMRNFETKKRTISPERSEKMIINIPISLSETFSIKNPGSNINEVTLNSKYGNQLTWTGNKVRIRMEANLARMLFDAICKQIVDHLKDLFMQPVVKDVSSILLVGGFAESLMLQSAIRDAFKNKKVIIPREADLAVLKGAVICGHEPEKISGRICRYTYGVSVAKKFDSTIHPNSKKILRNNKEYCADIFSIHVRVGQIVEVGEPQVMQTYYVSEPDQKYIRFKIFTSNNKEPTYTTDEGCTYLGNVSIDMPDPSKGLKRGAIVHMKFSGTEITVTAVDRDNKERTVTTKVDFLG